MGIRKFAYLSSVGIGDTHRSRSRSFFGTSAVHRVGGIRVRVYELCRFSGNVVRNCQLRYLTFLQAFISHGGGIGGIRCIDNRRTTCFLLRNGHIVAGLDGHGTGTIIIVVGNIKCCTAFARLGSTFH